jgi:hypothetical protein
VAERIVDITVREKRRTVTPHLSWVELPVRCKIFFSFIGDTVLDPIMPAVQRSVLHRSVTGQTPASRSILDTVTLRFPVSK